MTGVDGEDTKFWSLEVARSGFLITTIERGTSFDERCGHYDGQDEAVPSYRRFAQLVFLTCHVHIFLMFVPCSLLLASLEVSARTCCHFGRLRFTLRILAPSETPVTRDSGRYAFTEATRPAAKSIVPYPHGLPVFIVPSREGTRQNTANRISLHRIRGTSGSWNTIDH